MDFRPRHLCASELLARLVARLCRRVKRVEERGSGVRRGQRCRALRVSLCPIYVLVYGVRIDVLGLVLAGCGDRCEGEGGEAVELGECVELRVSESGEGIGADGLDLEGTAVGAGQFHPVLELWHPTLDHEHEQVVGVVDFGVDFDTLIVDSTGDSIASATDSLAEQRLVDDLLRPVPLLGIVGVGFEPAVMRLTIDADAIGRFRDAADLLVGGEKGGLRFGSEIVLFGGWVTRGERRGEGKRLRFRVVSHCRLFHGLIVARTGGCVGQASPPCARAPEGAGAGERRKSASGIAPDFAGAGKSAACGAGFGVCGADCAGMSAERGVGVRKGQ
jgi:hypothetical protein